MLPSYSDSQGRQSGESTELRGQEPAQLGDRKAQVLQGSECPELRGQAPTQVVEVKARNGLGKAVYVPAREIGGGVEDQ